MKINTFDGYTAVWNGGHYINEFDSQGREYNVFSFAWDQNKVTQLQALQAFLHYQLSDEES